MLPIVIKQEREAAAIIPKSMYVSIFDVLIDENHCVPVFTPSLKFISQDRRHFTQHGAEYVGGLLFQHPLLAPLI